MGIIHYFLFKVATPEIGGSLFYGYITILFYFVFVWDLLPVVCVKIRTLSQLRSGVYTICII